MILRGEDSKAETRAPFAIVLRPLEILKEFKSQPPVPGALTVVSFIDITVILPLELSLDIAASPNGFKGGRG